ncbi:probable sodium/metabolite cotransporter BASS1, chloroplastic isoform X2 [Cryptomeria japonica]|uniref:probable sodium/metabolite cotransporter BASS1, chloroplastic isoform X2 n=1 Tax=Cryptomeria japonica TaxID=3369 RepID=UPI0027DA1E2D|nr:probable sodium/metabolite cotransporter BASS1, chloroplastic isoform X2 [Cryptomeria japonica]
MAGICFSTSFSHCKSQISHLLSARSPISGQTRNSCSQYFGTLRNPQISSGFSNSEDSLKLINANPCKRPWSLHEFRSGKVTQVDCSRQRIEGLNEEGWSGRILQIGDILSAGFPLWIALACFAGLTRPQAFLWIRGKWQIAGLTLTMLGMGMTLSLKDIQGALAMPKELLAGVVLQYTVMPISGALVSKLLGLPSHYAAGLVLVACCPGGTASNVVTYLARGNVALSVLMTAASTFLAVIMTPLLTAKLAGQYVAVDAGGLLASTLQVVLLPVVTGAIMNQYIPTIVSKLSPFTPLVAIVAVSALCASAIAQNSSAILSSGGQVVVAVGALHLAGFFFGFILSKLLGFNNSTSRTISIEVGMQACF